MIDRHPRASSKAGGRPGRRAATGAGPADPRPRLTAGPADPRPRLTAGPADPRPRLTAGPADPRPRLTAGRLLAVLAAAGALAAVLLGRPAAPAAPAAPPAPRAVIVRPDRSRAGPEPPVGPGAPAAPARARPSVAGPAAVSRSFVVAYAAFVYGRLTAADLPALDPALRRRLAALHPDPAPAVLGAADPRLRSLRLAAGRPGRARAVAVIEDGPAVYDVVLELELRRRPAGWTIAGLGENG